MGEFLEKIITEIVAEFQINKIENLEIKKRIGNGFSGAEVYLIELKGSSECKGTYFLKIDTDEAEYTKLQEKFCFSNVALSVKSAIINNYYVMLLSIAGQSLLEYLPFYEIDKLSTRKLAINKIFPDILDQSISNKENYIGEEVKPSYLFGRQLKNKLGANSVLEEYVKTLVGKEEKIITGFRFENKYAFPNAYVYAIHDELWKNRKIRNTESFIHGDFHGNNVFFSNEKQKYALIDLALYRQDGYLFYDSSYFEFSLLINNFEQMNLIEWVELIQKIAVKDWPNIDCKNKELFMEIQKVESDWMNKQIDKMNSHKDSLFEASIIARIIVGLNFAGKRKVNAEIHKKAFIYACVYLGLVLELKEIESWKENIIAWNEISSHCDNDEIYKLTTDLENFSDVQKYILVLGDKYEYIPELYDAISRIRWSGIVSFKNTEGFEPVFKKYNVINSITSLDDLNLVTIENFWCLYANGVFYNPETIEYTFAKWRNKYMPFLGGWVKRIDSIIAPDELQIVIDMNSFSSSYTKRLSRFCEALDVAENININVAMISYNNKVSQEIIGEYEKINCKKYITSLESIASYCLKYLKGNQEGEITIPSINNIRRVIPRDDYNYIKSYVFLLHNRVLQNEGNIEEFSKRSFYYGKDILWQAINEQLFVKREEYEQFSIQIKNKIEKENQFLIRLVHSPGAGASVMCRVLCWELRNLYPVILVKDMNKNIVGSVQKLYSISGKHILLFADGDFNENDISQLQQQFRYGGMKVGIIFSYRSYESPERQLSILTTDDALDFSREYSRQMRILKNYPEDIIVKRSENIHKLATERSLANYRLPFFFGINAFEDDYISISDYLNGVFTYINSNSLIKKIVNYIALITYYTEDDGLNISYIKKIMGCDGKVSSKEILGKLNGIVNNFTYYSNGKFKICHSIVAVELLKKQYTMCSMEYKNFLEQFIRDIRSCEGKDISERLNNLFMTLFIKRDYEGDVADNLKKRNFSPIVLSLNNSNLQESFFAFLASEIPQNAHIKQHYGRLIIYNNPNRLEDAKEQFDKALDIEPESAIHYHARGNMYTKYVMNVCKNKSKNDTLVELFNKVSQMTENAIKDYETSIRLIKKSVDLTIDISYPYASIIQTITYVVNELYLKNTTEKNIKEFINLNTEISKWCKKYIQKAEQYDIDTEVRYDIIRDNEFYKKTRSFLIKYRYDIKELEIKMQKKPEDIKLMRDYLYSIDTRKEYWINKSQNDLKWIIICCTKIFRNDNNEGLLWRWFNASINYDKSDIVDMIAFLETIDNVQNSLTAQFMLYVIKFGKYYHTLDGKALEEILNHIDYCKRLNQNSDRISTRYYFNDLGKVGICHEREEGIYLEGIVKRWTSAQNGQLSLLFCPKLSAFFVPSIINMREEGAVGTKVKFRLGMSFDGFRAWDLKII